MARDTIVQFKPVVVGPSRSATRVKVADSNGPGGTTVTAKADVVMEEVAPGVVMHRPPVEALPGKARHGSTMIKSLGPADPSVLSPEAQAMREREIAASLPPGVSMPKPKPKLIGEPKVVEGEGQVIEQTQLETIGGAERIVR